MTSPETIIKVGVAIRKVARYYGFKNLKEYFKASEDLANTLPLDWTHDTGDYIVTVKEGAKIAHTVDEKKRGIVIFTKKLSFKHKGGK